MTYSRQVSVIACALLLATGCATTSIDKARYEKDGVQYGTTKGTFRGRWWNYYERGRSFQDGGFFAEAEADLRTAVRERSRDQLWARTYGLHFVPEYFPHRELGVTFFYQKRFEEAVSELELSLDQHYSARGAYFLNQARTELIQARSGPRTPPRIEFTQAISDAPLGVLETDVAGVASSENYVVRVWVGKQEVAVPVSSKEVTFSHRVFLTPGVNEIEVTAEDLAGERTAMALRLHADLDGPAVSFDTPIILPGTVRGVALDADGVASVTVAGTAATLVPGANGAVLFSAEVARPDAAQAGLMYESLDGLGNATKGAVPSDALRLSFNVMGAVLPHWRPDERGLSACRSEKSVLLAAAEGPSAPDSALHVEFQNLREGQQYQRDEIVASLRIDASTPIADATLNEYNLALLPERTLQYVSRRIALKPGANTVTATARDAQGNAGAATVTIERQPTPLEIPTNRLTMASLGLVWNGNPPRVEGEHAFILDRLTHEVASQDRFNLADRSLLPEVLNEQQLSAVLGSRNGRLALNQVVPAEVIVIGRARRDPSSLEVVMEAFSTETGLSIARADVAGRADTIEQLQQLVDDLALRVVQEFPKAQGEVKGIRGTMDAQSLPSAKPVLAIIGFSTGTDTGLSAAQMALIQEEFQRGLRASDRFSFVDRDVMSSLLSEQQIGEALGSRDALLAAGKVLSADALLSGQVTNRDGTLTASVETVDAASTESIARSEATGGLSSDDELQRLGARLAVEAQKALAGFAPKRVSNGAPESFVSSLGRRNLVRESTKCIVYRYGPDIVDPATKEVLGREINLLGEGLVRSLSDASSVAEVVSSKAGTQPQPFAPGDYVITK
ncbi:MAG: hypothetical protein WC655_20395 [Candidatus Hydrogenedentales bacterium]|jgi:curli biogenesis system outer membrane secretion channel CsgG